MTRYLIDSDILIDFLNRKEFGVSFFHNISGDELYLSVISWLEIMYGFKKSSSTRKLTIFQNLLKDFQIKILPIDTIIAQEYLDCKLALEDKKALLGDFDLLIASTAVIHNCQLVTRNIRHFSRITKLKIFK